MADAPPSTARAQVRRDQVLDAAAALFARSGFHGSSMAALAKNASMSVGHIYHYFESKDAIIEALVDREMERRPGVLPELAGLQPDEEPLTDRLEAEVHRVLSPETLALWSEITTEAARNPRIAAKLHASESAAHERLTRSVSARLTNLSAPELTDRVEAVAALFQGLTARAGHNPDLDPDAVVRITRLALRELLRDPGSPQHGA